jgi:hypothetical protein
MKVRLLSIENGADRNDVSIEIEVDGKREGYSLRRIDDAGVLVWIGNSEPSFFNQQWLTDPAFDIRPLVMAARLLLEGKKPMLPIELIRTKG